MQRTLTKGPITVQILLFALPLMLGNLLQQMYNIADTWVVGRFLGADALAAVGSAYTLMTFLTSIIIGLCMGSGAAISMQFGRNDAAGIRRSVFQSFALIGIITLVINVLVFVFFDGIIWVLQIPTEIRPLIKNYLTFIFFGLPAIFLYNYFSNLLRAVGNSVPPLIFLAVSSVLNIALDLFFVLNLHLGIPGAAFATALSQWIAGIGILLYVIFRFRHLLPGKADLHFDGPSLKNIGNLSLMTSLQQSIMNFGILMVQGLVNSFGTSVMAAFAAAVKIDSFAYMPVQDFGNAFSTFVAQNYGAGQRGRIRKGIRSALIASGIFSLVISALVFAFAGPLMQIFVSASESEVIRIGVSYLRIEGSCYIGIGILFLLYGYYRAVNRPAISILLTVVSLGTRVMLSYILSAIPVLGTTGIWMSIPIGWFLADAVGIGIYLSRSRISL